MEERRHLDPAFMPPPRRDRMDDLPLFTGARTADYRAELDALRLKDNLGRVLALMVDHQWHSIQELRQVGGASGDRRLRELRALGFRLEKQRDPSAPPSSGVYRYRLLGNFSPDTWRNAMDRLKHRQPSTTEAA